MFTFKKFEECRQAGLPKDAVDKSQRNVFHYSVNVDGLNDLLFVRFLPDMVQFFCENDENEVSETGRGRMLASISLRNAKETGNDLLYFADSDRLDWEIKDSQIERIKADKDSLIACLKTLCDIYSQFPFASELKKNILKGDPTFDDISDEKKFKHVKSAFLKFCLLEFVSTVETEDEIFTLYPGFEAMRGKLRQSKVYQLLCSKVKYDMLLYKDMENQCNEQVISDSEYNYVAKRFADLLMDKDLNKIIPPDYYGGEGWFDNPEEELNSVLKHTVKLKKHKTGEGEALKKKICDFFYAKHAIWYAQSTTAEKFFFVMAQISMAAFFIISGVSLLCFNVESFGTFADWYFSNFWWIAGGAVVGVLLFLAIIAIFISKSPNVFLPRIIVSVAIMWLVTFVSEDLIKSQIGIFDRWVIIVFAIVLLVIVLVLLIGEIRQHSPYDAFKHLRKWWWKPILLLNSFVFVVGVSGMLMQFVFYKDLLKGSGALSEIVYADYFDELDNYQNQLEVLKTSLRDYQQMSGSYRLRPKNASGRNHGNISFQSTDTLGNPISNTQGCIDMSVDIQQESPDGIVELYNQSVDIVRESVAALKSTMEDSYESRVEMQSTAVNTLFASQFISQCESEITKDTTFANILFNNLIYSHYEAEMEKDTNTVSVVEKWACDIIAQCDTTITIDTSNVEKILNDFIGNQRDLMSNRLVSFNAFFSNIGIIQDSIMNKIVDSSEADPVVAVNDGIATNIIMLIGQEQLRVEHNRLENNFDVLMDWSTYRENPKIDYSDFIRQSPYLAFIKNDAMNNHKVCREVGLKIDEKPMVLYPYLLLIHSLIILILAFVGQLFISKETVSEPL